MVADNPTHRLLLRAELVHGNARIVTHTIEISEALAFVQTDETAYIGDKVLVNFSFPGLIEPFVLETQVIARKMATGPGQPGGWTLGFTFYRDNERLQLRELLEHLHPPTGEPSAYSYRVLLVEDNLITREAFSLGANRIFADTGVLVDIAESSEAAWDKLQDKSYDLAIVDYFLPMLNGDRLIAKLRNEPTFAQLPIFAISVGGSEAREATLAAGADLFLHKPIVLRDLFHTLKQLASARKRPTQATQ